MFLISTVQCKFYCYSSEQSYEWFFSYFAFLPDHGTNRERPMQGMWLPNVVNFVVIFVWLNWCDLCYDLCMCAVFHGNLSFKKVTMDGICISRTYYVFHWQLHIFQWCIFDVFVFPSVSLIINFDFIFLGIHSYACKLLSLSYYVI